MLKLLINGVLLTECKKCTDEQQTFNKVIDKMKERFLDLMTERYPALSCCRDSVLKAYYIMEEVFSTGGILFTCGNGGSQADSDHIVGELSKGFLLKRELSADQISSFSKNLGEDASELCSKLQNGLRAMNLSSQPALATAYLNDVDPSMVLAQELFAMARKGDAVLGITTSGNAKNVLNTFKTAGGIGVKRILLTGNRHGICEKYADCVIDVPESETFRVQELHLPVYHTLCMMIEDHFYGKH